MLDRDLLIGLTSSGSQGFSFYAPALVGKDNSQDCLSMISDLTAASAGRCQGYARSKFCLCLGEPMRVPVGECVHQM